MNTKLRKSLVKVGIAIGCTSFAAKHSNKMGTELLDSFEKAITDAKEHSVRCNTIAIQKRLLATSSYNKTNEFISKVNAFMEKLRCESYKRSKKRQADADAIVNSGKKSLKFANNLSKLVQ